MREFRKLFVDTNVFLRVLIGDNSKQYKESKEFFEAISDNSKMKIYSSLVILMEIGWTLNSFYGYKKKEIIVALNSVEKTDGVKLVNGKVDFVKGMELFEKHKIKLGDAMIVASDVVQKERAIIISYDKDFDKVEGVKRITPKEATKLIVNY